MKNNIFLTSESYVVLSDLVKHIDLDNNKRMLFVSTASEIYEGERPWIKNALDELKSFGFEVEDYTLTDKTEEEVKNKLKDFDILYVAGGNNYYLLDKAQKTDFGKLAKDFVNNGGIYIGQSAGSVTAGPSTEPALTPDSAKLAESLDSLDGFGLVDFVILPHFGREDKREKYLQYRMKQAYNEKHKIILLTDNQYVRVQEDGMYRIEDVSK